MDKQTLYLPIMIGPFSRIRIFDEVADRIYDTALRESTACFKLVNSRQIASDQ